ncbi:MAG: tRNA lysidine(34) synthetase TilS, partial [Deltaproteobacteria bacterium]|nr:tRNA lysidine(34) synthetase TilS [Deltaproteobacteria bacterium]
MKMTPEDPRTGTDLLDPLDGINRSRRWFRPGQTVLVAFSAGLDSTALLDLLVRLAARVRFRVEAATVDHGLRPFSQEISTAAGLCARLSATHHVLALEPGLAERSRSACTSLQEQARTERYALLASIALRIGADRIATAHHADDQAETLLLRLSAGTGLDGLSGILEQRDDRVVRPLLSFRREDLERYVALRGLPFVEDPTNRSARFVRNRIRSSVIPALVEAVPSAVLGIARSAALLSNERAVVDSLLDEKLEKASRTALEMGQEGLSVAALG